MVVELTRAANIVYRLGAQGERRVARLDRRRGSHFAVVVVRPNSSVELLVL